MDFDTLVNDSWLELECKPEIVEVTAKEWQSTEEEHEIQEIFIKEENIIQQSKQTSRKQLKQQPKVKLSRPTKNKNNLINTGEISKKNSKRSYKKNYLVGDEAVKICRICLTPEGNKQFAKLFDPAQNTANDLYFISSIAVSFFASN